MICAAFAIYAHNAVVIVIVTSSNLIFDIQSDIIASCVQHAPKNKEEGLTSLPVFTPQARPLGSNSTSSTLLFNIKVPPWMAQRRENPSGRPPRPYKGYRYGLLP